ncbi:beta-ketoacyl synthase chain length factor [Ideonella oryzae]|uniref:Beta-ketoacyl synthase chain length factor n=1 Tax=Ideonella oryzae TaxID=2937441 RepID=A0ABT1BIK2_9BURK|nr:beta-ketoacyl synthase chain length factor [Ideonella oryzae]MCO5976026.1 beta-ketoacyl synthase chain length factor [Ideonella oryzae]
MSAPPFAVHVQGIGLFGPGMSGWSDALPVLRGERPLVLQPTVLPAPTSLPPAERRRVGLALKLAMAAGFDAVQVAGADASGLATVFSSTGGDCDNCHQLLDTLASADRAVSPTRFHNSVHNMPAGYWGIANQCQAPSTSLCAYDATFAAGLLEAVVQMQASGQPCLLVAYDTAYPAPLQQIRPIPHAVGVALLLSPTPGTGPALRVGWAQAPIDTLADPVLESLRTAVPAARALPLLQGLARQRHGTWVLEYLDQLQLRVELLP